MPRSKAKQKAKLAAADATASTGAPADTTDGISKLGTKFDFPYLQYVSLGGSHALLLAFAALALPRSSKWLGFKSIPQATSLDRPQHPFLNPVTANPAASVFTVSLGVLGIVVWWSGWVRLWWALEKKAARIDDSNERIRAKLLVSRRLDSCICDPLLKNLVCQAVRNALFATALGALVYHPLLILLGAPVARCVV
jgi:phosphatidylinositol glycan class F